jgi:hypothetical protein
LAKVLLALLDAGTVNLTKRARAFSGLARWKATTNGCNDFCAALIVWLTGLGAPVGRLKQCGTSLPGS